MSTTLSDDCPKCGSGDYGGYEVRGVYDGVLFWLCLNCGWAYPRIFGAPRMDGLSQRYADDFNREAE